MKKLFEKLIAFVRNLFCKEDKIEQEVENSYLIPLEITDIKVEKYRNDNFHLKISFPLEYKEEIKNIIINIQGDKKETGYIQCNHLTYDDPTKIQPLEGSRLPATFKLVPQVNCLNLNYEAPFFIMVDMISKELDIDIQLIAKENTYNCLSDSEVKHIKVIAD